MVFRIALRGAVQVLWRNRRVRLDEDAWLVLDGRQACGFQPDPEGGADLVEVEVSAELRQAGLVRAAQAVGAAEGLTGVEFGERTFADNLRTITSPAGQRLLEIVRARPPGSSRASSRSDLAGLVAACVDEERELRQRASRIVCVKAETREQLLRRILLAADFIASHHDEPLLLDEMARAASLSRFHFVRLFSLVLDETPHAFLLRKRTAVARRHLAVGSACSEAATRAGFGSRSALFRNLRKAGSLTNGPQTCFLSA